MTRRKKGKDKTGQQNKLQEGRESRKCSMKSRSMKRSWRSSKTTSKKSNFASDKRNRKMRQIIIRSLKSIGSRSSNKRQKELSLKRSKSKRKLEEEKNMKKKRVKGSFSSSKLLKSSKSSRKISQRLKRVSDKDSSESSKKRRLRESVWRSLLMMKLPSFWRDCETLRKKRQRGWSSKDSGRSTLRLKLRSTGSNGRQKWRQKGTSRRSTDFLRTATPPHTIAIEDHMLLTLFLPLHRRYVATLTCWASPSKKLICNAPSCLHLIRSSSSQEEETSWMRKLPSSSNFWRPRFLSFGSKQTYILLDARNSTWALNEICYSSK